jgi:hypothetical protein
MEENLYAPPNAIVADYAPSRDDADVRFFAVSPLKLVVLSTCTLGLYQIYWFYKHWVLIKERSEPHIIAWARAFFGIFWCYNCFEFIREEEKRLGVEPTLSAGPLAIGWIALELSSRLPKPYFLPMFLAPLVLALVQRHINHINELVAPDHDRNTRFSAWNWLAVVVGGIFIGLIILGLAVQARPHA